MSAAQILAGMVCFAGFAVWLVVMPRIWRNEWKWAWKPDAPPAGWPYGGASWRGFARLTPLGGVSLGLLPLAVLLDSMSADWAQVAGGILIAASTVLLVLIVSVVLFNRPKAVVAPHLRHQPGMLAEWRGARVGPTAAPRARPRPPDQQRGRRA